jgi:hypothetical protein
MLFAESICLLVVLGDIGQIYLQISITVSVFVQKLQEKRITLYDTGPEEFSAI